MRTAVVLAAAAAGVFATGSHGAPVSFLIPPEPADRALLAFSRQAHTRVLFSYDALEKVKSPGLEGVFEPEEAIARLLSGTAFVPRANGQGGFVIAAAPATTAAGRRRAGNDPLAATRMAPFWVKARGEGSTAPLDAASVAVGNLDLPRSENDALPFLVYSREQISRSGQTNLDDFLRQQVLESDAAGASADEGGIPDTRVHAAYFNGSSNLNLRAYGSDETLVLVNGLPMPKVLSAFSPGGQSSQRSADVNLVPLNLVERVEVLPVSAAALYSGNPVGGVINVVLRPVENIDELTVTYTNGLKVDAPDTYLSLLHGQTLLGGRLSYRLAAAFDRSRPPSEQELGHIQHNLLSHADIAYPPIHPSPLYRATPNVFSAQPGAGLFGPGSADTTSVAPGADGTGGLAAFSARQGVASLGLYRAPGGMASSPDSLEYAYGRRQFSQSWFGTATYDLFPTVQLGVEGLVSHKVINPGFDVFEGNLRMLAGNPLNPFGQDVFVNLAEAAPALGQGYDESHLSLYSGVAGLLIKLPGEWRISGDAEYSHALTSYRGVEGVDTQRWQQLVDTGQYNPLRDTQAYGPPPAFYDQALIYFGRRGKFINLDNYQSADGALRLINTDLPLPTGPAAITLGADYNLQYQSSFNDNQYRGDGTLADTSGYWRGRTLQAVSTFAEIQASLLPAGWRRGWVQDVKLDAAGRYTAAHTGFGTNLAPTFGAKVDLAGGFALRGSVSNTNRFPTATTSRFTPVIPGEVGLPLSGGPTGTLITDPRLGNLRYNVSSLETVESALQAEADVTQSAGLIWQRGDRNRVRLAVDWVQTRKAGELAFLDTQDVVDFETLLPGRVVRAPAAPGGPPGPIAIVYTSNINLAWRHSQDWDFSLDYARTGVFGGVFAVYGRYVYFQRYDREVVPNSVPVDELSHPDTSGLDLVRHRVNFGGSWTGRHLGGGIDGRFFSPRLLPELLWTDQGSNHVNSYCPFDAYVKAVLTSHLTAELRVDNLLNAPLPKFPDIPSGTGVEPYGDWRGRVYALTITASF